jgi:hypothetical protein
MNAEQVRLLVESMASEYPAAYRLAQVVSLAVRIEPELLRKARLTLLPEVDAGAEADLWFSPLVQSQSPVAMTFLPEATELLRARLGEDPALLKGAWDLLNKFHEHAPPALRLEEEVTWLALSKENNADVIKERLDSVIAAIVKENRPGLVQWANRALPAMPAKARDSDAARILSLVSRTEEIAANLNLPGSAGSGIINERLASIISHTLPKVQVGVRLLTEAAATGPEKKSPGSADEIPIPLSKQKIIVEFSYPPATESHDGNLIEVPQTNPLLIEVSWAGEVDRNIERLSLDHGDTRRLEVGSSELDIRTALGDVHTLKLRFDFDFFLYYTNDDRAWSDSLRDRLGREVHEDRALKPYRFPIDAYSSPSPLLLSRKICFMMSPESVEEDWNHIKRIALKRGDAARIADWLIPIRHEPGETPAELRDLSIVDFSSRSNFEESYRQLVATITGEPSAVAATPAQSLLGMPIADAHKTDFFSFFHLEQSGSAPDSMGRPILIFKPTAAEFRKLVDVRTTLDAHDRIVQVDLLVARSFLNDRLQGVFAADIAKSMLTASLPLSDQPDVGSLIEEITNTRRQGTSIPESPGYLAYLGRGNDHTQTLSSSMLGFENIFQNGEEWLQIRTALRVPPLVDFSVPTTETESSQPESVPTTDRTPGTINFFISFAEKDGVFRDHLLEQIQVFEKEELNVKFGYAPITPGMEYRKDIEEQLSTCDIILLIISPEYLASKFVTGSAMRRAIERHRAGKACVIPIIARPVDWTSSFLSQLRCLPRNAKPITEWRQRDDAYVDVVQGIRAAIESLQAKRAGNFKWALDVIQSLALVFHVGGLEPDRLNDDAALKQFYGLKTDVRLSDFRHVRKMCEYVFAGPVTEYLAGKDPFQAKSAAALDNLRELIDSTRADPARNPWLSGRIQDIIARADDADRKGLQRLLGESVWRYFTARRIFPQNQLQRILDTLSSSEFLAIAGKYLNDFSLLFDSASTILSGTRDFPTYMVSVIGLWKVYVHSSFKQRGDIVIKVNFPVPYSSLEEFQRRFPNVTFTMDQRRGMRNQDDQVGGPWTITLGNFERAVARLADVVVAALRSSRPATMPSNVEQRSLRKTAARSKPSFSRTVPKRPASRKRASKTTSARSDSSTRGASKANLKQAVTRKSRTTGSKATKKSSTRRPAKLTRKAPGWTPKKR